MNRIDAAIILAAIFATIFATVVALTGSALAAEPASSRVDACTDASDMQKVAWCNMAASHVAELSGDLRGALQLADQASQYLSDDTVTVRAIELRAALGAQYIGFAREAVYRCSAVKDMPGSALRTRAVRACKAAYKTVLN
ncbi:MAG: hypothetical protein ACI9WU_004464 [Myxococcota bacterium]|jgi:hypothetical protein